MRWLLTTWKFGDPNDPDHFIREPILPDGVTMIANWANQGENQALILAEGDSPIDPGSTGAEDITDRLKNDETFRIQLAPDFGIVPNWNPDELAQTMIGGR